MATSFEPTTRLGLRGLLAPEIGDTLAPINASRDLKFAMARLS